MSNKDEGLVSKVGGSLFFGGVGALFGLIPAAALVFMFGEEAGEAGIPFLYLYGGALGGFFFGSRFNEMQDRTASEPLPAKLPEKNQPLIDPWGGIDLCKQGQMEYQVIIALCEQQILRGDGNSAACLAWLYDRGPSSVRDKDKARALYRKAALLGHEMALNHLIASERVEARDEVMTDEQRSAQMASLLERFGEAVEEVQRERRAATGVEQKASVGGC